MGALSIPLQVQAPAPQPSVIQNLGQLMQARQAASEIALRQQQTAQSQQATENLKAEQTERNEALAAQNAYVQALKDPEVSKQVNTGNFDALKTQIAPKYLQPIIEAQQKIEGQARTATSEQNKLASDALGQIVDSTAGLKQLVGEDGNLDKVNAQLPGVIQHLQSLNAFKNAGLAPPSNLTLNSVDQLDTLLSGAVGQKALHDKIVAEQQAEADVKNKQASTSNLAADAALKTAQAPGAAATSEKEGLQLQAMKAALANPATASAGIDAQIDPKKHPTENAQAKGAYRALIANGVPPDRAAEHVATIAQSVREKDLEVGKELNPDVRNAKIQDHLREEYNALPPKIQLQDRQAALTNLQRDTEAASTKIGDSDQLKSMISQARGGNQAAGGILTVEELRSIVNRVNKNELEQAGGGSAYRNVENWASHFTGGVVSADQLNDLDKLADAQKAAAQHTYALKVGATNHTYKTDLKPYDFNVSSGGSVAPIALKDGRTLVPHDAAAAAAFRKDHADLIK